MSQPEPPLVRAGEAAVVLGAIFGPVAFTWFLVFLLWLAGAL